MPRTLQINSATGDSFQMPANARARLVRACVVEFCSRFLADSEVVSIRGARRVADAGVVHPMITDDADALPDLVLLTSDQMVVVVDADRPDAPMTDARLHQLHERFRDLGTAIAPVSALPDRAALATHLRRIDLLGTVWLASEPDHLIHFGEPRLHGPHDAAERDG